MCKMLFIATQSNLREIPRNDGRPDFFMEKISGEFLPVKHAFKNPNIYFAGTSRGCSCDVGIKSNKRDVLVLGQMPPIENLFNKFRRLTGTFEAWEKRHIEYINNQVQQQASYLRQTLKLIEIILKETQDGNVVEMYCVWAGDYKDQPEMCKEVDTTKVNLKEDFEIDEREFITFL